jgi:hypothetical protein
MGHIILLGDSIFDNGVYVPGEPDVVKQLRAVLPSGWKATLLAVDGAVTRGVASQLTRIPADATHLVVSVGGNDALGESHILSSPARLVGEAVMMLADAQERFARSYADMLEGVLGTELPTALCTIYDTPPSAPNQRIIRLRFPSSTTSSPGRPSATDCRSSTCASSAARRRIMPIRSSPRPGAARRSRPPSPA